MRLSLIPFSASHAERGRRTYFGILMCMLFIGASNTHLSADEASDVDLVEFFKKATSKPPDVRHFRATQRMLRVPILPPGSPKHSFPTGQQWDRVAVFEGARIGPDFYTRFIRETNASSETIEVDLVTGRADSTSFQVNVNALTTTEEKPGSSLDNPAASASQNHYNLLCQFLNMGLAGVEPSTVVWAGQAFTASLVSGRTVIGELAISNSLPIRLELFSNGDRSASKAFEYAYPSPPDRLGGFPQKTVVFSKSSDGLAPAIEVSLIEVEMDDGRTESAPIKVSDFITSRQIFTNVYSNGGLYAILPDGRTLKSPRRTGGPTPYKEGSVLGKQIVIFGLFGMTTGLVLLVWLQTRGNLSKRENKND